jgi:hypothetical protein
LAAGVLAGVAVLFAAVLVLAAPVELYLAAVVCCTTTLFTEDAAVCCVESAEAVSGVAMVRAVAASARPIAGTWWIETRLSARA